MKRIIWKKYKDNGGGGGGVWGSKNLHSGEQVKL